MTARRRIVLPFPPRPHELLLGAGLLAELGRELADVVPPGPCALVTDTAVAATPHAAAAEAALRASGFRVVVHVLPSGEAAKSMDEVQRLWTAFAAAGIDRRSAVVALGGGAVGDSAGFAAATWMRGVPLVQVPTTLLAMADSALGGKTAVNLPAAKNLVGAVHMPELVIADVGTLATLPDREFRSGLAEIVKCAVLEDRARLASITAAAPALLARDAGALVEWIAFAAAVKAEHVRSDPLDTNGIRALLNLGHTIGHALEAESGYGALLHGEAVAIGLVEEARIAASRELCAASLADEIAAALTAFGLPTAVPPSIDRTALDARCRLDKKNASGRRRIVLPLAEGGAALVEA